jgi:myo-inositol-1(or 4)-monophosphatase
MSLDDRAALLSLVRGVALEAATLLAGAVGQRHTITTKGTGVDLVTEVDLASEKLILSRLRAAFPGDHILAEESGGAQQRGGRRWLIDPLDGTTNYAHGFPFFCVSIGLEIDGELELGVVRAPLLGWEFAAARGLGATLNGQPIHVSSITEMERALLATGFPYDRKTSPENNFDNFIALQKQAGAVRRAGSAALDLCMVAAGWLDGYWELKLSPWDLAAGVLIAREAGARVTALDGSPFQLENGRVVATNGHLHDPLVAALERVRIAKG